MMDVTDKGQLWGNCYAKNALFMATPEIFHSLFTQLWNVGFNIQTYDTAD